MNKILLRLLGAVSVSALLFSAGPAGAATSITLTGTVPQLCGLSVNTGAGATGIALQTSQTALAVGSVDESCNDDAGYTVGMTTTNGVTSGIFVSGAGDAAHSLPYAVSYDGVLETPIAGFIEVTNVSARVAGSGSVNKPLTIAFTGATSVKSAATDYTDTLTFAMTAK